MELFDFVKFWRGASKIVESIKRREGRIHVSEGITAAAGSRIAKD